MNINLPKRIGFDEGLLVSNNIRVFDGGQDPHLIEGILLLLFREVDHLHLLQGVYLRVRYPLDLIYARVGPLSQLG